MEHLSSSWFKSFSSHGEAIIQFLINLENSISLHVITLSNHGEAIIQFRTNLEHFSSCYFKSFFNHSEVIIQFRSNLLCLSWSFLKIFFSHGEEIIQFQSSLEYWSIWAAYILEFTPCTYKSRLSVFLDIWSQAKFSAHSFCCDFYMVNFAAHTVFFFAHLMKNWNKYSAHVCHPF